MAAALYRQYLLPLPQAFISSYKFSAFLNGRGHWFYVTWLVKCWLDHYSDVISGNGLCDRRPNTNQKELTTLTERDLGCCTASPMSLQSPPEYCVCVHIANGPTSEFCSLEKIPIMSFHLHCLEMMMFSHHRVISLIYLWKQMSVFVLVLKWIFN